MGTSSLDGKERWTRRRDLFAVRSRVAMKVNLTDETDIESKRVLGVDTIGVCNNIPPTILK